MLVDMKYEAEVC